MAIVNRYSNLQPARYTPRTLQELMVAPSYMRGQHNQLDEAREGLGAELAKVDPLLVHSELAKKRQAELYDKMSKQAEELATKGFSPTSKTDFIRLNKEYQQEISPMGELGKINAAKQVYAKNFQDYIEDATKNKKWSRETAIDNWNKFEKANYTGFDSQGKVTNIGQFGAPEKIELTQKLKDTKALLGEQVVKELAAGNFKVARQEDGSLMVVNQNGRRIETSNARNIQSAMKMLASELSDPNSAWNKSIQFEGIDPVKFEEQLTGGLNAMITTKVTDNRTKSVNFTGVKNLNDIDPTNTSVPSVTEPVMEYNNTRDGLSKTLKLLGQPKLGQTGTTSNYPTIGSTGAAGFQMEGKSGSIETYSEKDLSKAEVTQYHNIWSAMINSGVLPKNAAKYSPAANEKIQQYLDETASFSFSNKILKPTAIDNDLQKPLIFTPKKGYDMSSHIKQEVEGGRRKLYDKVTQEELDVQGKGYTFEYVGMYSPDNVLEPNSTTTLNEESFVLPHLVQYKDPKTGATKEAFMDRDAEEMKKPEFKASSIIKKGLFAAKTSLGLKNIITGTSLQGQGIQSMELKYNPKLSLLESNSALNTKLTEEEKRDYVEDSYDVKFTDIYGNTTEGKALSSAQIQNQVYRLFAQKK